MHQAEIWNEHNDFVLTARPFSCPHLHSFSFSTPSICLPLSSFFSFIFLLVPLLSFLLLSFLSMSSFLFLLVHAPPLSLFPLSFISLLFCFFPSVPIHLPPFFFIFSPPPHLILTRPERGWVSMTHCRFCIGESAMHFQAESPKTKSYYNFKAAYEISTKFDDWVYSKFSLVMQTYSVIQYSLQPPAPSRMVRDTWTKFYMQTCDILHTIHDAH